MQKTVPVAIAAILLAIIGCESQDHALLRAIRQKNVEAVRTMVESGAELEPQSGLHDVNKPLAYAAAYGNLGKPGDSHLFSHGDRTCVEHC